MKSVHLLDLQVQDLKEKSNSAAIASAVTALFYFSYMMIMFPAQAWGIFSFLAAILFAAWHRYFIIAKGQLTNQQFKKVFTGNIFFVSLAWSLGAYYLSQIDPTHFNIIVLVVLMMGMISSATLRLQCSKRDYYIFSGTFLTSSVFIESHLAHTKMQYLFLTVFNIIYFLFLKTQHKHSYNNWLKLQLQNLEMQKIIDTFPGGLSVVKNDKYTWVNQFIYKHILLEKIDIKNKNIHELDINKDFKKSLIEFKKSIELDRQVEVSLETVDGLRSYIIFFHRESLEESAEIIITSLDIHEITEMKKDLEHQKKLFFDKEKLASLGEMAAGLAHEINNPLAIISTRIQLLEKKIKKYVESTNQSSFLSDTQLINQTTQRISIIVKGLKAYSHQADNEEFVQQGLSTIVNDTLSFCQERFKSRGVELILNYHDGSDVEPFDVRPIQFSQVLLNAFNNAFDAVENIDNKKIILESWIKQSQLEIHIKDSGPGIPIELREKIMDAFVTTKPKGEGTGLGLSISQRIINQHNGKIFFDFTQSETCLVIRVPLKQGQFLFFSQSS